MKYLKITLLLLFVGCQMDYPKIGQTSDPFVVTSITVALWDTEKGMCHYLGTAGSGISGPNKKGEICLPCGLYQIGDTIKIGK